MTKFQYYYEKEGKRFNLGKKSRNDFKYAVLHDNWNCGSPSYHTAYEKAVKRVNWNKKWHDRAYVVELKFEEI